MRNMLRDFFYHLHIHNFCWYLTQLSIWRALTLFEDTREKNEAFGSSLLLANTPSCVSPKIVNGSFAAIIDADEFLAKEYAGIRIAVRKLLNHLFFRNFIILRIFQNHDSPAMRRRVRGILMSGKQFSLDSRMDLAIQGIEATTSQVNNGAQQAIDESDEQICQEGTKAR